MINRHITTKIPYLDTSRPSKLLPSARSSDNRRKSNAKEYADKRHKATPSDIRQGDQVLLLQRRTNKLTTKFDPNPFTVLRRKGVSVELARGEARLSRNLSMVKKLIPATKNTDQSRRSVHHGHAPRYSDTTAQNTGHSVWPSRERCIPSYLNDFIVSQSIQFLCYRFWVSFVTEIFSFVSLFFF